MRMQLQSCIKKLSIAVMQTKVINCNSANKRCLFLARCAHKSYRALTQFCDFCLLVEIGSLKKIWKFGEKKIAKLRQSCDSFCVHNMHETTFVCTIAINNVCLHYYNWQHLFALLQLITFVCTAITALNAKWDNILF